MAAASTVTILGLGNPLLDISVDADTALCTKYGLAMGNAILATEAHTPLYAEITTAPFTPLYVAGGATLNSIRVSQWISGGPAGYSAFVGSIGEDAFGAQLSASAQADAVATLFQTQPAGGKPTGTCAVLIQDKERSLCANLAAAEHLAAAHLDSPAVQAAVASARIYYTAGFPLTHDGGAESALTLSKLAVEGGKTYALNLSAPFITQVPVSGKPSAREARVCVNARRLTPPPTPPPLPPPPPPVLQVPPGRRVCQCLLCVWQ